MNASQKKNKKSKFVLDLIKEYSATWTALLNYDLAYEGRSHDEVSYRQPVKRK